jgi:hypothetical protein
MQVTSKDNNNNKLPPLPIFSTQEDVKKKISFFIVNNFFAQKTYLLVHFC